ncbi:hypothetical protein Tco_1571932 [Tanacetum coccineum]
MVVLMLCYFIRIMDPTSSIGRICLGENIYGSPTEKVEWHGDWDAPKYTDTAGSKEKKVTNALNFYKMETDKIYFVKFIINPKEDDMKPGVILGRSFMRLVNGIVDFGSEVITVYLEQDPFKNDSEKTKKSMGDWDHSHNKKRAMENLNLFYPDIRPSSSTSRHLTQEEAAKEALALRISERFALLEEVRPVLKTRGI